MSEMVSPSDPKQEGSEEVFHDGMDDKGHEDQMHGGSQSDQTGDSGQEENEK